VKRAGIDFGLSISLLVQAPAAAAPPLQPLKPWNIHFNDTDCLAERPYGSPDDGVVLGFRPSPSGDTFELIVARKGGGDKFATQLRASVELGQRTLKASALRYHPVGTLTVDKYQVSKGDVSASASADTIAFRNDKIGVERFTLSAWPQVLKTLDQCNEDLRKFWNMTSPVVVTEAKPTTGDLRKIFTSDDYPDEAMSRDTEGNAQFLILVSEKGAVSNCYVAKPSGSPALDGMGCQVIMQRAKFAPAKDKDGKPIRSAVLTPPIIWRISG
jgi:TonB family protein